MEFNIATLLESVCDGASDKEAIVCGDKRLTYQELDERANRFAHMLKEQGIGPGDHVGLYLYNGTEFLEAMYGTLKLRAVPININYRYVEDELLYLFKDADLVSVVFNREYAPRVKAICEKCPKLRHYVYVDDASGEELSEFSGVIPKEYEVAIGEYPAIRDFGERSGEDIFIVYTGGTTGMPKGVMWRHEDLFFAGLQGGNPGGDPIERAEELGENVAAGMTMGLTFLPVAPFIHGNAQWSALIGWFGAGKIVVIPGPSFEPELVCQAISQEQVNTITLVGDAMARPLADQILKGQTDISSVMVVASAGAILSDSVKGALQDVLPDAMILNNFGATETGHQGTSFSDSESGRPTFVMDASNLVVDEDRKPLEPGTGVVGLLARRGRLPIGYYNDPEKTARTFVEIDGERWVITGDMATLEEDGQVTVLGRGALCINTGGEKVFPEEVEEALKAHAGIMDALVVGIPNDKWGQSVVALVESRKGVSLSDLELVEHCKSKVAGYKVPRQYHYVDAIMRQPSGKPDYKWAKKIAEGQAPVE